MENKIVCVINDSLFAKRGEEVDLLTITKSKSEPHHGPPAAQQDLYKRY
jgi:hypothetical protein